MQLMGMNGTAHKCYSFLIGVVIYRQTSRSCTIKGKGTICTPPVFKSYGRIPEFSTGDLTKRSNLHCFVRAIAIHADRIIPTPRFLWYKMTVIARYYGVLRTEVETMLKLRFFANKTRNL